MSVGTEFTAWAKAVEAACLEVGCPVDVEFFPGPQPSYLWAMAGTEPEGQTEEHMQSFSARYFATYDAFHRACVLMDHLRPAWLVPSPKLAELLGSNR